MRKQTQGSKSVKKAWMWAELETDMWLEKGPPGMQEKSEIIKKSLKNKG